MPWYRTFALLLSSYLLIVTHADASPTPGRCGLAGSTCPDHQCCSGDGQCGFSNAHCGAGCQEPFGICNESAVALPDVAEYTININTTTEAKDAGLLARLVNSTMLAGLSPGSLWGTLPVGDVLSLCDIMEEGGNHTVAVTVSDGNYTLVMYVSVTAADCGADIDEYPFTTRLVDSLGRESLILCNNQQSPTCGVYSAGSQAEGPAPSARTAKVEVLAPRPGGVSTTSTGKESHIVSIIAYVVGGLLIMIIKAGIIVWLTKRGSMPVVEVQGAGVQMDVQLC